MSNSFVTPWTVARQAPLSLGFSRQEYWSGLLFIFPGDLPDPGIEPASPALSGRFFTTEPPGNFPPLLLYYALDGKGCPRWDQVTIGVRDWWSQSHRQGAWGPRIVLWNPQMGVIMDSHMDFLPASGPALPVSAPEFSSGGLPCLMALPQREERTSGISDSFHT